MAIQRSPNFRFDYFLRSRPTELIGRRCEQLMKAAEKEVEQLERKAREDAGLITEYEKKGDSNAKETAIELPDFKTLRTQRRVAAQQAEDAEQQQLEEKVFDLEQQIREVQDRMKVLNEYSRETTQPAASAEFPDDLLPELTSLIAKSGTHSIAFISNNFAADHSGRVSKKKIASKINDIAVKEKREEEGDMKPSWYLRSEYENLLDVDTLQYLRLAKEERLRMGAETGEANQQRYADGAEGGDNEAGAMGPDGDFVPFPEYDGVEEPKECKKAFTHFCNGTRKQVKKSLDPSMRKDKVCDHTLTNFEDLVDRI